MKKQFLCAIAAALAGFATPAAAEPIMLSSANVGQSFTVFYNGFADGTTIDNLSASATFTLTSATADTYSFDYLVNNTTTGDVGSRISSFAFNTNPDIISASSTGIYDYTVTDSNYPNGIGTVDVCFKAARTNSCAGNSGGLTEGQSGSGTLSLSFHGPISSLTIDDFFVRYQSITGVDGISSASGMQIGGSTTTGGSTGGSTTSGGSSGGTTTSGGTSGGTPVPEPGMLGLFGATLLGLGLMQRRRRRQLVN